MLSCLARGYGTWNGEFYPYMKEDGEEETVTHLSKEDLPQHAVTLFPSLNLPAKTPERTLKLPRTYLTKRGALLLFSSINGVENKQPKHASRLIDLSLKIGTLKRLSKSILQYGDEDYNHEKTSISDAESRFFLKFLHDLGGRHFNSDLHSRPGSDLHFYLQDLKTRSSGRTHGSSLSAHHLSAELQEILQELDRAWPPVHDSRNAEGNFFHSSSTTPETDTPRSALTPKVLSSQKLAASLKSTTYLGRPLSSVSDAAKGNFWPREDSDVGEMYYPFPGLQKSHSDFWSGTGSMTTASVQSQTITSALDNHKFSHAEPLQSLNAQEENTDSVASSFLEEDDIILPFDGEEMKSEKHQLMPVTMVTSSLKSPETIIKPDTLFLVRHSKDVWSPGDLNSDLVSGIIQPLKPPYNELGISQLVPSPEPCSPAPSQLSRSSSHTSQLSEAVFRPESDDLPVSHLSEAVLQLQTSLQSHYQQVPAEEAHINQDSCRPSSATSSEASLPQEAGVDAETLVSHQVDTTVLSSKPSMPEIAQAEIQLPPTSLEDSARMLTPVVTTVLWESEKTGTHMVDRSVEAVMISDNAAEICSSSSTQGSMVSYSAGSIKPSTDHPSLTPKPMKIVSHLPRPPTELKPLKTRSQGVVKGVKQEKTKPFGKDYVKAMEIANTNGKEATSAEPAKKKMSKKEIERNKWKNYVPPPPKRIVVKAEKKLFIPDHMHDALIRHDDISNQLLEEEMMHKRQEVEASLAGPTLDVEDGEGLTAEELKIAEEALKLRLQEATASLDKPTTTGPLSKVATSRKDRRSQKAAPRRDLLAIHAKEREALREQRKLEKLQKLQEALELQEKIKAKERERRQKDEEAKLKQKELEEEMRRLEQEAEEIREAEEQARVQMEAERQLQWKEREARRKADLERRKQLAVSRREKEKEMAEKVRRQEQEMLERIADAEVKRRFREEEQLKADEAERLALEQFEEEIRNAQLEAEEDERRMQELEREAEEEAMQRLVKEREQAEYERRQLLEEAERIRMLEEQYRLEMLQEEQTLVEEKKRKEKVEQMKIEEERQRLIALQQLEEAAREQVRLELERRREEAMRKREKNLDNRDNVERLQQGQALTRPWIFSYFVLWPKETYLEPIGGDPKDKKGGGAKKKK